MTSAKKFVTFLLIILSAVDLKAQEKIFSIEAGPEYRHEDFRWSIAGNMEGTNPNILSELIFKPINAMGFYTSGAFKFHDKVSFEAHYNKLFTYQGEVTDFDYDSDNRTDPKTELYLQSNKGHMTSVGGRFIYDFFDNKQFTAATALGYDFTRELFYLTNEFDPSLKSTYHADWNGPNLTLTGLMKFDIYSFGAGITGHYLKYNAKANWNLVEEFQHPVSFRQKADGHGFDYRLSLGFRPADFLEIGLHGLYSAWRTGYGKDILYSTSGEIFEARLNGAFKKNYGLRLSTTFIF